jgi:hypothetical protein
MNETRKRRIERGLIIPDDMTNERLERLSRIFWNAERASDGFAVGWDRASTGTRETIRAGIIALLSAIEEEQG